MDKASENDKALRTARILIVDDEPENIAVLLKLLRGKGYDVRASRDAAHALKTLGTLSFDLILLDIRMPKISGFMFCEQLKGSKDSANIPVIFLTASTDVEDKVKGLELGAVDYITKPFDLDEVLARVARQLKLKSEYKKRGGGEGEYRNTSLDGRRRREICQQLINWFEEDKPYLDENLNVETIARKLRISRHNLSEAINVELKRNFSTLLNRYRIEHFCELLKQQPDTPILDLALQSGYNTKSVFNRWFKAIKNTTPKKFSKSLSG